MPDRLMIGDQPLAHVTVLERAVVSPVRRRLIMALYTYDMLTRNTLAASRTDIPASTAAKIRSRKSCE
jgi:hypothetical protein